MAPTQPPTYRPSAIDIGNTTDMNAVVSQARTAIPVDVEFLIKKHESIFKKMKFVDCVCDRATGEARRGFRPEERFLIHVSRPLPERVEADVAPARGFVQNLFTFRGVEPAPRVDDSDFTKMPLLQFVILVIGAAVARDTKLKRLYAMIGQHNSGKEMLMTAVTSTFGASWTRGRARTTF